MPVLIATPFATNGTKNDIPETTGAQPQNATMDEGFPAITQQPISTGGIPPERADFNGILYALSDNISHINKGLAYSFDTTFATKIGGYPLHAELVMEDGTRVVSTIANNMNNPDVDLTGWRKGVPASDVVDESGKTQQEINNETTIFKAESDTVPVPMVNVIKDRIIVDTYAKSGDSSHVQAINRAILASRNYEQAAIWFNNHDYELDDTILLSGLSNLQMHFAGGRLVATVQNKNILEATNCNGLKFNDIKILGLGAQTTQRANEFGILLDSCIDSKIDGARISEIVGQAAIRVLNCTDTTIPDLVIDKYSYAGLQVIGNSHNTSAKGFKILNGKGALSSGSSGYGVHLSSATASGGGYPTLVFLEDFEIIGNNWDGINSHGSGDTFIRNGVIKEVKNGIEFAIDEAVDSYIRNANFENIDIECFNSAWNTATQGGVTNLSSGFGVASNDVTNRRCEGVTINNVNVKYANNSGGGTGDNAGIRLHGINKLRVNGGSSSESKVQGMRLYGYIDDFEINGFSAKDITTSGIQLGTNLSNGLINGFKFGNSGGSEYTGLSAIQAASTGSVNVIEKNTQLTTSNVLKYANNAGGQLRFKQEEISTAYDPNNATYSANLAGFKVGDVLRSPTVFGSVLYAGWMCTAIDTVTPSMTWKRYGATV